MVKNFLAHGNGVDAHMGATFSGALDKKNNIFGTLYYAWISDDSEITIDPKIDGGGKLTSGFSRANHSAILISGVNDGAQTDPWGNTMLTYPNIGADQHDYAPGFGPWSTCDASLPTDGQVFKSHAAPIAAKKITAFPGVASQSQINEAAE